MPLLSSSIHGEKKASRRRRRRRRLLLLYYTTILPRISYPLLHPPPSPLLLVRHPENFVRSSSKDSSFLCHERRAGKQGRKQFVDVVFVQRREGSSRSLSKEE